jgi:hypothetical protein
VTVVDENETTARAVSVPFTPSWTVGLAFPKLVPLIVRVLPLADAARMVWASAV